MLLIAFILILLFAIALGVSQRLRTKAARRSVHVAAALIGLSGLIVITLIAVDFFAIDACLDSGGSWDSDQKSCRREAP